jgi:CubicO group peptidase (beta-lactamase class C family)
MKVFLSIISILISSVAFSQTDIDGTISKILNSHVGSESEPGLTIGVVKNGELIYHSNRGIMNLEYKLPFNDSTVFGLASVTKQFTSACIAILENQGKLTITDDVRKYIPELANYKETIQIKHLLNHTSGIRNHNVLLDLKGFDYQHRGYTNKMIQELMFKQKGINNSPGAKMLYSNTNYVLLALIIERVTGMKIEEFAHHLQKEIEEILKLDIN